MKRETYIEKAMKGGWRRNKRHDFLVSKISGSTMPIEVGLLDPRAWQAVGKVEGWEISLKNDTKEDWFNKMHHMIDALAEGKSLENFIKTL